MYDSQENEISFGTKDSIKGIQNEAPSVKTPKSITKNSTNK